MFEDTYNTISASSEGLYKEKGSRFIALAFPVNHEDEIKNILGDLRKKYHDARHHCYAYILGYDKSTYRINDDGEPSGTAGKPIYGQILSSDLTNILIVVIRYFGGTLLGVSGLIRAYKTAAKDAIEHASIITKTVNDVYTINFGYSVMNNVMSLLKLHDVAFINQKHDTKSQISFSVRKNDSNKIYDALKKLEGVDIKYEKTI